MSEQRTEASTPEHRKKARDKGERVRSREMLSAVAMLAGVLALGQVARSFAHAWRSVFERSLLASRGGTDGELQWSAAIRDMVTPVLPSLATVMAASFAGALLTGMAQGRGLGIYPNAMGLQKAKLNPVANLRNLFSLRSGERLARAMIPAAVISILGWRVLRGLMVPMPVISFQRLPHLFSAMYSLALDAALLSLVWSGVDYAVEWRAWNKRMKMTKQEIRDERKQTQGDPLAKERSGRARRAMRLLKRS